MSQEFASEDLIETCQPCKLGFGCTPYPSTSLCHTYQKVCAISRAKWRKEKEAFVTGNLSQVLPGRSPSPRFEESLGPSTWSPPGLTPQEPMFSKKTLGSPARSSSSVYCRSEGTPPPIGTPSEKPPSPEPWMKFRQMCSYVVTTNCAELARTISSQLQWSEPVQFSGGQLLQESRVELGKKQVWRLILKIPEPNGGTDTWARSMLSLTNSEVC